MEKKPKLSKLVTVLDDKQAIIHYGVLGMKWGVRKSRGEKIGSSIARKTRKNEKLAKKAEKASAKSRVLSKKADDRQSKVDMKIQKALTKAAKAEAKRDMYKERYAIERKGKFHSKFMAQQTKYSEMMAEAEKLKLGQAKIRDKSNTFSLKAENYKSKIQKNNAYISALKKEMSSLPKEERALGQEIIEQALKKKS